MDPTKEQLEAMLADYVDGNLSGDELAQAETFLEENPGVRAVMTRLMLDSEAIRALPRVGAPHDLSETLRGQIERDMLLGDGMPVLRARRLSTPQLAAAAMLVVGLGIGVVAYQLLVNRAEPTIVAIKESDQEKPSTSAAVPSGDAPGGAGRGPAELTRRGVDDERFEAVPPIAPSAPVSPARDRTNVAEGVAEGVAESVADGAPAPAGAPTVDPSSFTVSSVAAADAKTVQLSPAPIPAEVAAWAADRSANRSGSTTATRAVVFVLDVDPIPGERLADEAAIYFGDERRAQHVSRSGGLHVPAGVANASDAQPSDTGHASGGALSNVVPRSATDDAIAATTMPVNEPTNEPIGLVATDVSEATAAQWQAQLDASMGGGRVTAYELPQGVALSPMRDISLSKALPELPIPATQSTDIVRPDNTTTQSHVPMMIEAPSGASQNQSILPPVAPAGEPPRAIEDVRRESTQPQRPTQDQSMEQQISGARIDAPQSATVPTEARRVDVYIVVRRSAASPATQPTSMPSTMPTE